MPTRITCILVDDDETSRFILTNLTKKNDDLNVIKSCSNAREARDVIESQKIDLMFLDIEMPYENGIDMLEKLESIPNIIFITSQAKHAVRAFEFDAIDYIVKPVDLKRLNSAIEKAKRRIFGNRTEAVFENTDEESLIVKKNRVTQKIPYSNIDFIEGSSSYVTYMTSSGKITTTGILKQLEETLNPEVFVRVHRSFLVNITKVSKLTSHEVVIRNEKLPLSRKYRKDVVTIFNEINSKSYENSTD